MECFEEGCSNAPQAGRAYCKAHEFGCEICDTSMPAGFDFCEDCGRVLGVRTYEGMSVPQYKAYEDWYNAGEVALTNLVKYGYVRDK